MSTTCKYCNEAEDKQSQPGLICESCICFVHLSCLRRPGTPGDFNGDVFFEFTCEDCSPDRKEVFVRNKFPWVNVIYLTLSHLATHSYGIGHHGYFHYKTHICSFIDRYWSTLFGVSNKQKKNWIGTIAGVLSVYNKLLFKSGLTALGEAGWWRLLHNFSPAVAAHIVQELARDKPKNRPRNMSMDKNHFVGRISEMGYKELLNLEPEESPRESEVVPGKKRRVHSGDSVASANSYYDYLDSDGGRHDLVEESTLEDSFHMLSGAELSLDMTHLTELKHFDIASCDRILPLHSDTSSVHSLQHSTINYDSDSRSGSDHEKKIEAKRKKYEEKPFIRRENLFSTELNSIDFPWEEEIPKKKDEEIPNKMEEVSAKKAPRELMEMTEYQEVHFLKQIEGMIPKVRDPNKRAYLHRLKAKLALRRLKRHKHLPIFDLDKTMKLLGGYVTEDPRVVVNSERVLDRFQRSYLLDKLCGTVSSPHCGTVLVCGVGGVGGGGAVRARGGAPLKPYIRRDGDSAPLYLVLMDELLRKTNKHIKDYCPRRGTIDYSYVRPQHIPALNALCAQHFWPGIDLTESLQYPEHSCVVTYRQVAVGCAFLVPGGAGGASDAYISFVLTRPEWRRAGIATFMLYHLLQTCTGQDVTLHVSPTNPAIFLYQKFGFKVEEFVQDFYEKYYDIDYKGCRHALFLRLVR